MSGYRNTNICMNRNIVIKNQFNKNIKDILVDKDKLRKITERAFSELDTDHQGAISFQELVIFTITHYFRKSS